MKVAVLLHAEAGRAEVAYALATLLEASGLPFELSDAPPPGALALHYGAPPGEIVQGVTIPADDAQRWSGAEPELARVEGLPILHIGAAPEALLSQQGQAVRLGFDLVRAAFWLLSRQEEADPTKRDALGRFPCAENWLVRHGLAGTPLVNLYAELLAQALMLAAGLQGLPLLRKARWPGGRRYAVVLSHDVDDVGQHGPGDGLRLLGRGLAQRSLRGVARGAKFTATGFGRLLSRKPDPFWNFESIMSFESQAGFRSSFYFVPTTQNINRDPAYDVDSPRLRAALARLRADGWEVAAHGNFDSSLDAASLQAQRLKLERAAGAEVAGIRQHFVRLTVPDTFRAQAEAGYVYDSTLGFRAAAGFRAGTALPFHPYDPAAGGPLPLLELPLTVMDGALFWHLELSPQEAAERVLALLETTRSHGGLVVLLWHQRVRYEKLYPGWWPVYRAAVEHLRDEGRAWVATGAQVAEWWLAREALRLESIQAGDGLWRFRAGQAIEELVLELAGAGQAQLSVAGAGAVVQPTGDGSLRIVLEPLASGQVFEITLQGAAQR